MLPVIVLGTGLEARLASDIVQMNENVLYGFFSLDEKSKEEEIHEISVLGTVHDSLFQELIEKDDKVDIVIADADISNRKAFMDILKEISDKMPVNCFHPASSVSPHAYIGHGNLAGACAVIPPDAEIGDMNLIQANVSMEPGVKIGSYVNIGCGVVISREVIIEDGVIIGNGAILTAGIVLQSGCIVSPGAVVFQSINRNARVSGNPAGEISK